jgi:hypothetical protein
MSSIKLGHIHHFSGYFLVGGFCFVGLDDPAIDCSACGLMFFVAAFDLFFRNP